MTDDLASHFRARLTRFQTQLTATQAALISKPTDIFYYTGFPQLAPAEREALLVISPKTAALFHHSFSPAPAKQPWLKSIPKTDLTGVASWLAESKIQTLLIDENTLTVAEYSQLKKLFVGTLSSLSDRWVWQQRMVKDASELARMKTAGRVVAKVFEHIQKELKPGLTEQAIANRIMALMLEEGAQESAFPTIVAFGENSALPHHQPTARALKPETPVLFDFGARFQGYCSDLTRTVWFGKKPSKKFQEIEQIVQAAYQQTVALLHKRPAKLTAKNLDEAARTYIANHGFGDQFIHTTGHGLGIEIHEPPSLSWQNETLIKQGMTITIEPGIYLNKEFGYRYENTVVVTERGVEILTTL